MEINLAKVKEQLVYGAKEFFVYHITKEVYKALNISKAIKDIVKYFFNTKPVIYFLNMLANDIHSEVSKSVKIDTNTEKYTSDNEFLDNALKSQLKILGIELLRYPSPVDIELRWKESLNKYIEETKETCLSCKHVSSCLLYKNGWDIVCGRYINKRNVKI